MKLIKFVYLPNKAKYDIKGDLLFYFYFLDNKTEFTREITKDTDEYNTLLKEYGKVVSPKCKVFKVNENIYADDNIATISSKISIALTTVDDVTITPVELSLSSVSKKHVNIKHLYNALKSYCSTFISDIDIDEGLPMWCFKLLKKYIDTDSIFVDSEPTERGTDTRFSYGDFVDFLSVNGIYLTNDTLSINAEHLITSNIKDSKLNSIIQIITNRNIDTTIYEESNIFEVLSKYTSSNYRSYLYENVTSLDDIHIVCNTIQDVISTYDNIFCIHTLFPSFKKYESTTQIQEDIEKVSIENTLKQQIELIKVIETSEAENKLQNFVQAYYNSNKDTVRTPDTYIERFQIVCDTNKGVTIPIESIFKRLHVTEKYPFARLKLHQSTEKMYRIYSKNDSKDIHYRQSDVEGYIEKHETASVHVSGTIMRNFWKHNSGPGKTISILCAIDERNEKYVSIDIKDDGLIIITSINDEIHILRDILEDTIISYVNPVLSVVSNTISDRGYTLGTIQNFNNNSIKSVDCDLKIEYPSFDFKLSDCFIPSILFLKSKSSILGIYKRTSNIRQEELTDYVIDWADKNGIHRQKIPTLLTNYFGISLESSAEIFREWIDKNDQEYAGGRDRVLNFSSLTSITFNNIIKKGTTERKYVTSIQNCDIRFSGRIINDILDTLYTVSLNKSDKDSLVKLGELCSDINLRKSSLPVQLEETSGDIDISITSDDDDTDNESLDLDMETSQGERNNGGIDIDDLLGDYSEDDSEDDSDVDSEDGDTTDKEDISDDDEDDKPTRREPVMDYVSPEETFFGGAKTSQLTSDKQISLTNPNYFFSRLKTREPTLFLNKKQGRFDVYSRLCPHNIRRQPVILTDEEKDNIDTNYPGSYTHTFKYGSTPENQHWYICPRYWCMKTNTSMTEEDVKAGKCGGSSKIIPFNAKHVPDDAFVYEFKSGERAKFKDRYPGFIDKSNHPDNIGVPCCFTSFDSKTQERRRKEYLRQGGDDGDGLGDGHGDDDKLDTIQEVDGDVSHKVGELPKQAWKKRLFENYFIGPDKFPIEQGRWGFIPISVQRVMGVDKNICFISRGDSKTTRKKCLLRQGIQNHPTQSFIACISDVLTDIRYLAELEKTQTTVKSKGKVRSAPLPKSIKECKEYITSIITIDDFINYNNGNLVDIFMQKEQHDRLDSELDIDSIKGTRTYSMYISRGEQGIRTLKALYSAFLSFKEYILQDEEPITHEFLWDIVCTPHKDIFPNGINLVIFKMPYSDVTDNVELVCPSDSYSKIIFDKHKPTLILLERDGFYEPIYIRREKGNKISRTKLFRLKTDGDVLGNIERFFTVIQQTQEKCISKNSIPGIYTFEEPVSANDVIKALNTSIVQPEVVKESDAIEFVPSPDEIITTDISDVTQIPPSTIITSATSTTTTDIPTTTTEIKQTKKKRCPNGTRLNKKTGKCEPK